MGLLASPVSWSHHWVWIVPALFLLLQRTWGNRWGLAATSLAVVTFAVGPHSLLDPEGRNWSFPEHLLGSGYVLLGVAFLIAAALPGVLSRRRSAAPLEEVRV